MNKIMKRPSITFINRIYPPQNGASGRMLQDLAQAFAREGWRVTIITTGNTSTKKERDGQVHVKRIKAKQNPRSIWDYLWILIRLTFATLQEPAPSAVATLTDPPLTILAGDWIKRIKKCRHIHWCHDLYPDLLPVIGKNINPHRLQQAYSKSRTAMERADRIIVIGRCMGKLLSQDGINPSRITFIPNWANKQLSTQKTQNSPPPPLHDKSYARAHKDQIKGAPRFRILYAGTLGLTHPIDTIIETAKILQKDQSLAEFTFVGQGEGYERLAAQRAYHQLDNIRLLPPQPEDKLKELMQSGDIHLISMNEDAAGMLVPCKLYSAFAATRPCIFLGPSASEAAKAIEEFKAGQLIAQGHAEDLAQAINTYITNADQWLTHQKGALKAAEIYRPEQSIESWIKRAWNVIEPDM